MVWFLPTVARGDQLLSSSSLVVFALNGEASVESSTFIYLRAEAVFVLVRVLGHISGLCIHPTINVRATFHVALGWRRVRRAGRFRLLGGFIHSSTRAAITRTQLCPFGLLSSAVPFMALSHISPSSYGRCSLNSALLRMGMAVMARSVRPCHHPTSLHSQYPPMRTRTQPYLIRGCVLGTRFSIDSLYNIGIFEMCNPREM